MKKQIIFIVGATATGKTKFAHLLAKKINGEIISADSVSIYRGMDIISSKPSGLMRNEMLYYLVDVVSVGREYNVAKFVKAVASQVRQILRREKVPIIVGGSGLYVDSLLYGLFKARASNLKLRKKLNYEAERFGSEKLYRRLEVLDPEAAAKIHPNNTRRIIRALEVCIETGDKFSKLKEKRSGLVDKYEVKIFGLNLKRDILYTRIDQRVDKMFKDDLVEEVKSLFKSKLSKTANQALGIKEIRGYLGGDYDIARAAYLLKRNTRHFAKRQITWFKRNKAIIWIDAESTARKKINTVISQI
ncbi:MAG TPA: tRNA (adenosine(37)-N6)-dimethylallyltransferase MiaA [Candidatus Omnitrophica bacterium]|nr:tRNA (adenosine(37)-N6)-dimethylallyltransferase MiaA [Candidatus Omnitrophota bacterium]